MDAKKKYSDLNIASLPQLLIYLYSFQECTFGLLLFSPIFELCHIFKGFISSFYVMIFSCIPVASHRYSQFFLYLKNME
jgi:hypothetical protein